MLMTKLFKLHVFQAALVRIHRYHVIKVSYNVMFGIFQSTTFAFTVSINHINRPLTDTDSRWGMLRKAERKAKLSNIDSTCT